MKKGIPYVGFGNETLAMLPKAEKGQEVDCPRCGGKHILSASKGSRTELLFYKCGDVLYLAGIDGRLVMKIKPDVSGKI